MKGIFTAHGQTKEEALRNPVLKELICEGIIEKIIFLQANEQGRTIEVEETTC